MYESIYRSLSTKFSDKLWNDGFTEASANVDSIMFELFSHAYSDDEYVSNNAYYNLGVIEAYTEGKLYQI